MNVSNQTESLLMSVQSRIQMAIARSYKLVSDVEEKLETASDRIEMHHGDRSSIESINREVEGYVIKHLPMIKEQFSLIS